MPRGKFRRALQAKTRLSRERVLAWAKLNARPYIWLDAKGQWHAATNLYHVPTSAQAVEEHIWEQKP